MATDLQDVLKSHRDFVDKVKAQIKAVADGRPPDPPLPLRDKESLLQDAQARLGAARKAKEEAVQRFDREIAEQEKTIARLQKEIADDQKGATAVGGTPQQAALAAEPAAKAAPAKKGKKKPVKAAARKKSGG